MSNMKKKENLLGFKSHKHCKGHTATCPALTSGALPCIILFQTGTGNEKRKNNIKMFNESTFKHNSTRSSMLN